MAIRREWGDMIMLHMYVIGNENIDMNDCITHEKLILMMQLEIMVKEVTKTWENSTLIGKMLSQLKSCQK